MLPQCNIAEKIPTFIRLEKYWLSLIINPRHAHPFECGLVQFFFSRGGPKFLIWLGSNFLRWWVGPKYLRQVGPNKFYGNISFIDWRAALFGNKGLWGRRRRGQSFTILQACVVCVNGHNVLQCKGSRWVTQWVTVLHVHSSHKYTSTHTTWVRMGLTMVRGKREREGFWTNALF